MSPQSSQQCLERASRVIPGGVNSPVRAYKAVGGNPPFIQTGRGSRIWDTQGREYIDYVGSWGPAILGHAKEEVVGAVQAAAARGLSFGAPTLGEVEMAERLTEIYPGLDMVRCVSSGTEATMSALRVARGFTNRSVIVKFAGGYHGHADCLLVKAGSGAATFGAPDSAGVPEGAAKDTLTLQYNDIPALKELFSTRGSDIAAVIVEPVAGNMGCIPPDPGFLECIIELCTQHGAVSIFDEVMTGSRLSLSGAQGRYGLRSDMTCLGKVIGGGMPLAAYGGRRDIMSCVAPLGAVYQAGTLSGNPLAVAAGITTLQLLVPEVYDRLEALGQRLETGLQSAISEARVTACVQRVGAMITLFFHPGPVRNWDDSAATDKPAFGKWFNGMLKQGVYWPPSAFEAAFLSAAHTEADIDRTVEAAARSLQGLAGS